MRIGQQSHIGSFTFIAGLIAAAIIGGQRTASASSVATIDYPGATSTTVQGLNGNTLVGTYTDSSNAQHGFTYDGANFNQLDVPTTFGANTNARGMSGNSIVGFYTDSSSKIHGFLFNGTNYSTLDDPSATNGTYALGIDGSNIVGQFLSPQSGFLFDGTNYQTLFASNAIETVALGINGNNVLGTYADSSSVLHGMIYNINTQNYSTLDAPGGGTGAGQGTELISAQGNNMVGRYFDSSGVQHAFWYDGSSFHDLILPGSINSVATGINGDTVVGYYSDSGNVSHGFETTIPEPASFTLLAGCIASLTVRKRKRF